MKLNFITILLLLFLLQVKAQNKLTPEALWKFGRISDEQVSPDGNMVMFGITNYDVAANKGLRTIYLIPVAGGESKKLVELNTNMYNARWRPDGKKIGFLCTSSGSMQLWEVNPDGTGLKQISNFNQPIDNFAYSPSLDHISFTMNVKLDQTLVDKYPDLPKATGRLIDDLMYRHWNEWHDYTFSHVHFAKYSDETITSEPVDIMKGERYNSPLKPFGGTEHIVWSPDGKIIAYISKKQSGKEYATGTNSDLYIYSIESGKTENLSEGMMGYDTDPVFSPDGSKIAWLSMERAGFEADNNVIYLLDLTSKKKKPVTKGFDYSAAHITWSKDASKLFFTSTINATGQIYEINLKGKNFDKINPVLADIKAITTGIHDYNSVSVAGEYLLGAKTTMTSPSELYRIDRKTGKDQALTSVNRNLISGLNFGKVEKRMVKTTDNKDMLVWVIFPPDFDPNKKYPTLLYCQGGPQSVISQGFSYRWNFQLMAANGYIIVAPNRRGLPSFGKEWNDAISGDWGGQAIKDYLSAIDEVSKEPYVDKNKLGAVGASYGGYSVYYLAGNHNKRFKTFISHCGLFNLESWYGSTEEMFFANWDIGGPYWENPTPTSYQKFSPHKFVQNWDTPILVIHGEKDFRVPVTQGMEAFNAAQLQGIPSKFLYFPDEGHWIMQPQNSILWNRVFFEWLDSYLK